MPYFGPTVYQTVIPRNIKLGEAPIGTRVAIRPRRKHSKIEITYTGEDELRRLLALLQPQPETAAPHAPGQALRHDEK